MRAKILFLDIETAPALSYHWGMWDQNIGTNQVKHDWYLLCYAAKWSGEAKVHTDAIWNYKKEFKKDPRSDRKLCSTLWDLLDEADIVIAHNGDQFDIKKARARFLYHGYEPYSPIKTVDTLKEARKNFNFMSNKLDHILRTMGLGHKLEHCGFGMWLGAMSGDRKSCRDMLKYNIVDTKKLEDVYMLMRGWMAQHPNVNLYGDKVDREACPNCGDKRPQRRGVQVANTRRYPRFQCQKCGRWWRGKHHIDIGGK